MTLEEMKQHEWVVSWSGGKDSTATILLMREHNVPIKEIVYVRMMYDETTPATLPVMTDFVDRARRQFEQWGLPVTVIYSRPATDYINTLYKKSIFADRNGKPYGVSQFFRGHCRFEAEKEITIKKMDKDAYQMIGYAADEVERLKKLGDKKQSIMVELGIPEAQTYDICREYGLLSPLYELGFTRDGCWFCPNAAKKYRQYMRENHPELVAKINHMIELSHSNYDISSMIKYGRNNWLKDWYKEKTEPEQLEFEGV